MQLFHKIGDVFDFSRLLFLSHIVFSGTAHPTVLHIHHNIVMLIAIRQFSELAIWQIRTKVRNPLVLSQFCSSVLSICNDRLPILQGMHSCERLF